MNILFVNYGDFSSNSLNHIAAFAGRLTDLGHAAIVAVPWGMDTLGAVHRPRFRALLFREILDSDLRFPDGRHADIIHAWTPRELVRRFVIEYQRRAHARLIIHLEDNEEHLLSARSGFSADALAAMPEEQLAAVCEEVFAHPRRTRQLLRVSDGATVIVPSLASFLPAGLEHITLYPGLEPDLFDNLPGTEEARHTLGLDGSRKIIAYPGSSNFANAGEMRDLYAAIARLNESGIPATLVRTGHDSDTFLASVPEDHRRYVVHLGFIDKKKIPLLLAAADVLVQPGDPGSYNDFRLPSKIPEFLRSGKPVVLPATNIAGDLRHGLDAWIVPNGRPETLAEACRKILSDPGLAKQLGENGARFAETHFDLAVQTNHLVEFYARVISTPARSGSTSRLASHGSEISLSLRALADRLTTGENLPEAARQAAELVPLVEQLEAPDASIHERDQARRERDQWRIHFENARNHARHLEEAASATAVHVQNLEATVDTTMAQVTQLSERAARLATTIHEHRNEIIRRNEKIKTIESSFSWWVTLPFRWVRRRLIDPYRCAESAPAPILSEIAPPAPPCSPPGLYGLPHSIDEPRNWTLPPRKHLLRGWVFHPDANELRGIRAVLSDRIIEGVYGFKRLDVAVSARNKPQAEFCGWRIEADIQESDTSLEIQALEESGVWLPFFRVGLRVGTDLAEADLSRYEEWLEVYDAQSTNTLRAQRFRAEQAVGMPLISVIMPVFNTPERWLRRAIESVRGQSYPFWELCIADDASTESHVGTILTEAAAADSRIKFVRRETNGHISAASNSALELATGQFVALLDHDDELAPNALFEVAQAIVRKPDADLVYSDEDKIDEDGRRFAPYFKPDWNPDLFLGQNYISHLSVFRTALLREAGGFRVGFEGSQDWDLALRVVARSAAERIIHIPRVLYHWRAIPGSTALELSEKNYPVDAARRALADHFARQQTEVQLEPVPGDHWRAIYPLPDPAPVVTIVIPTRNCLDHLRLCVDSILTKTVYPHFEIIVVDNQSDDPTTLRWLSAIGTDERVRIIPYPHAFNYSAINNLAVRAAQGSIVALLNNDIEVISPDWLSEMVRQASRPEIGCVGAMLYYPNDMIQHAGVVLGIGGVAGHAFRDFPRGSEGVFNRGRLVQNYSAVTAACLVVRKAVYEQVGGMDETELAVAFNDIDFCLKVRRAGFRNLWTPFAELYHHESATRGADDTPEKKDRFEREIEVMLRRWGPDLTNDPAYNPNLTLELNDFSLAIPPRPARV